MTVPGNRFTVINLDKAYAFFDKSPRDESLPAMHRVAIGLSDVRGLPADIEGVNRLDVHAGGQFVRLDARLNPSIFLARGLMSTIQLGQQRKLTLLIFRCGIVVFDVLD